MLVKLKYMDESVDSFEVEDSLAVGELKTKNSRTPVALQKFVFRGRILRNEKTLRHYQVSHNDVIHCIVTQQAQRANPTNILNPTRFVPPVQGNRNPFTFGGSSSVGFGFGSSNTPESRSAAAGGRNNIFGRNPSEGFGSSHTHQTQSAPASLSGVSTVQQTPPGAPGPRGEPIGGFLYHMLQHLDEESDSDEEEEQEVYVHRFPLISLFLPRPPSEPETSDEEHLQNPNPNRRILTARRCLPQNQGNASQQADGFQPQNSPGNGVQSESFQSTGFTPRLQSPGSPFNFQEAFDIAARSRLAQEAARQQRVVEAERLLGEVAVLNDRAQHLLGLLNNLISQETPTGQRNRFQQLQQQQDRLLTQTGLFRLQPHGAFSFQPQPTPPNSGLVGTPAQSTAVQSENLPPVVQQSGARPSGVTVTYVDITGQTRELPLSQAREFTFNTNSQRGSRSHYQGDATENPPMPGIDQVIDYSDDDLYS